MRTRARAVELFGVMWLAAAPACLPAGDPPAGRPVWTGRDRSLIGVLPARSPDDGVTRILAIQQSRGSFQYDLSVLSAPPTGPATEVALVERWTCSGMTVCPGVDHKGRVLAWSGPAEQLPGTIPQPALTRIDLDTGERVEFGVVGEYEFSPSHRRVALKLGPLGPGNAGVRVLEPDDADSVELSNAQYPAFVGEDLYFVQDRKILARLPGDGSPLEVIREGVQFFFALSTTDGPRLLLHLSSPDGLMAGPLALLDPRTGVERPLRPPLGLDPSVSPDGRWALLQSADNERRAFTLVELATGTEDPFELPVRGGQFEWRPGHAEVWFQAGDWPELSAYVKRPGEPLLQLPPTVIPSVGLSGSSFSRDGSRLFSIEPSDGGGIFATFVGDADDPAGERFRLNPVGTRLTQYRELPDGRLVVEAFFRGVDRNDIYVVDPKDGASRLVGKNGGVLAAGARRVLAMTHRVDQVGDLEVIDIDVEQSTRLATEFAVNAFAQPRLDDADLVRSGAPVAFQFRARFASPYDGFWVTTLP